MNKKRKFQLLYLFYILTSIFLLLELLTDNFGFGKPSYVINIVLITLNIFDIISMIISRWKNK